MRLGVLSSILERIQRDTSRHDSLREVLSYDGPRLDIRSRASGSSSASSMVQSIVGNRNMPWVHNMLDRNTPWGHNMLERNSIYLETDSSKTYSSPSYTSHSLVEKYW